MAAEEEPHGYQTQETGWIQIKQETKKRISDPAEYRKG
jgi:hypothetical protein